jgi:hypothetical protein
MTELFDEDDFDIPESGEGEEFDLDSLRASSARAGSMFDEEMEDLEFDEIPTESSSGFALASFTPGQRLVLASLLLFDIIAVGVGLLVVSGVL